jgi:hypothetical protein
MKVKVKIKKIYCKNLIIIYQNYKQIILKTKTNKKIMNVLSMNLIISKYNYYKIKYQI